MKSWYSIKNIAGKTKVYIFEEIGFWGVTAKNFLEDIKGVGDIELHINSVGGSVFDALAIYHTLRQHSGVVDVYIDGLAASSASIIAMAGNTVHMPENAFMMIHDPTMMAWGDSDEMQKALDLLTKTKEIIINIYVEKSGGDRTALEAAMSKETWYTGSEAKAMGLVDVVTDPVELAARASFSDYKNIPKEIMARFSKERLTHKEFESHLRDAFGFSRSEATAVAGHGLGALKHGDRATETAEMLRNAAMQIKSI